MPRTDAGWHTLEKGRFAVHTWIVILGGDPAYCLFEAPSPLSVELSRLG